jgi:tetratricopeptide (TPR) repeat protein
LSGQYSESATIFEQLLTTATDDAERGILYLLYGTASDYGEDYEQAKRSYENVVRLEPTNWVAHNNLAYMLCEHLGQCAEARAYAERAMALVPESHVVADTLATVLIGLGEERRAIGILMQALEREPAFVTGLIHLADAYRRIGEFALAQTQLEEARQLIEAESPGRSSEQSEKVTALLDRVRSRDSSP